MYRIAEQTAVYAVKLKISPSFPNLFSIPPNPPLKGGNGEGEIIIMKSFLAPLSRAKKAKHPLSSPLQKKRSILCPPPSCRGERGGLGEGLGVRAIT